MEPSLTELVKLLQGGGNVALIAAAWMLWKSVQSLTRIEVFMSMLFEVLLRADGIKIRESDKEKLRIMQSHMTVSGKDKQRGFIIMNFLRLLGFGTILVLAAFSGYAQAQVSPCADAAVTTKSDAAYVCWTNATHLVPVPPATVGDPIPAPPDPKALKHTRIFRSLCKADGTQGTIVQTLNVTPDVLAVLYENLTPVGVDHCFSARHVQFNDNLSASSALVKKAIKAQPPVTPPKSKQPSSITIK